MPLPYILAAVTVYGAKKIYDHITEDDVSSYTHTQTSSWNKQTIVIGPKGSGKTRLAHLLASQENLLGAVHQPTIEKTTVGSYISDYPGDEHCVNTDWVDAIKKTTYCLYVFDLKNYDDNIIYENHEYKKLVLWHIDLIDDWIKQKGGNSCNPFATSYCKLIVIGTHADSLEKEDDPKRILNGIKIELQKRNKNISMRAYDLLKIKSDKLINEIDKD